MRKSSGQNRHACAPYTRVPAADGHRVVVPGRLGGRDGCVADEPRVAGRRRIDLALEPGEHARVAQVIARQVLARAGIRRARRAGPAGPPRRARTRPPRRRRPRRSRSRRTRPPGRRARSAPASRPAREASSRPAAWAGSRAPATSPDRRSRCGPRPAGPGPAATPAGVPGSASSSPTSASRSARLQAAKLGRADDRRQRRRERPVVLDRDAGHERVGDGSQQACRCVIAARSRSARGAFSPQEEGADDGAARRSWPRRRLRRRGTPA